MWDTICEQSFQLLKQMIIQEPFKSYVLFTDASKYAWSCVLTQEYVYKIDGKEKKVLHPITYKSGLFKGSHLNWGCLTKEAYAIYMSIKKLAYYLEEADITLRSDHLPLKKFLAKILLTQKLIIGQWKFLLFRSPLNTLKVLKIL